MDIPTYGHIYVHTYVGMYIPIHICICVCTGAEEKMRVAFFANCVAKIWDVEKS
jgi:hypothetical protein